MELLLQIPKDKPPFIGVVFNRVKEACERYQELVNDHPDFPFYLKFNQPNGDKVSFYIASEKLKGFWHYKDVKCDPVKLENFLYMTRTKTSFNFAHVLRDFDQDIIVTTANGYRKFALKIEGLYLMS